MTFASLSITMKWLLLTSWYRGFPDGTVVMNPPANARNPRKMGSSPESGQSPGEGTGNPLQYFLPGKVNGQRRLEGYSPRDCKELDMTKRLSTHTVSWYIYFQAEEKLAKRENSAVRLLG